MKDTERLDKLGVSKYSLYYKGTNSKHLRICRSHTLSHILEVCFIFICDLPFLLTTVLEQALCLLCPVSSVLKNTEDSAKVIWEAASFSFQAAIRWHGINFQETWSLRLIFSPQF